MIAVKIGSSELSLDKVEESWVNNQINGRLRDGQTVCVRVTIHEDSTNMVLTTPGCATSAGGGRPPNSNEQNIFDLWERLGLNKPDFHGGNVNAFLKQLRRFIH